MLELGVTTGIRELQLREKYYIHACIVGNVAQALRSDMIRKRLDTPLDLVGIKNNAKVNLYAQAPAYWNDKGLCRLQSLEQEYEKVRQC